jgi:hypothetical protein
MMRALLSAGATAVASHAGEGGFRDSPLHAAIAWPPLRPHLPLLLSREPGGSEAGGKAGRAAPWPWLQAAADDTGRRPLDLVQDGAGKTPLLLALESRYRDGVRLLLEAGANPTAAVKGPGAPGAGSGTPTKRAGKGSAAQPAPPAPAERNTAAYGRVLGEGLEATERSLKLELHGEWSAVAAAAQKHAPTAEVDSVVARLAALRRAHDELRESEAKLKGREVESAQWKVVAADLVRWGCCMQRCIQGSCRFVVAASPSMMPSSAALGEQTACPVAAARRALS